MLRILLLIFLLLISSCLNTNNVMVVDFAPICSIVKNIIKDEYNVYCLIDKGFDPHLYELKPKDFIMIKRSKIFITIGSGFPYIKSLTKNFNGKIINVSKYVKMIDENPHIWISVSNAIKITKGLRYELSKYGLIDENRYEKFMEELLELKRDYETMLKNCNKSTVITIHPILEYLSNEFGFNNIYFRYEHEEISFKDINFVLNKIREENINYIIVEKGFESPEIEYLSKNLGIKILRIDVIGNSSKKSYIKIMRDLLIALKTSLEC